MELNLHFGKIAINGHSTAVYDNLVSYVKNLLGVNENAIEDTIISMKAKDELVLEDRYDETEWVYLSQFYKAEENIAQKIKTLKNASNSKKIKGINTEIKKIEKHIGIELSEKQEQAINVINENNVSVITGGPGTGKTTIIKVIIELFKNHGMKPVLCAPTGRAAKRMTETTGEEAKTLHRLLELTSAKETDLDNYSTDLLVTPIDADIIIVDEMSMVDMFLMNYLLNGIYMGTKLVLVGDIDQLPSVGPGSVLKDIISSNEVETVVLNHIFRQAAKSKIIVNAHRVNEGENFIGAKEQKLEVEDEKDEKYEEVSLLNDFFFVNDNNAESIVSNVVSLCNGRLKQYGDYNFLDNIQIITPTKKGPAGTKELNKLLQEKLNSPSKEKNEKQYGDVIFRENDRVMQVKNNYNMMWEKNEERGRKELGNGVFNGELGIIEKIDLQDKSILVKFDDGKKAIYQGEDIEELEHAYAITIHKAQGSEFDVVIMPIYQIAPMLQTRNLLYTAITRAKKMIIIIGNREVVDFMIKNNNTKNRNTGLCYKLQKNR